MIAGLCKGSTTDSDSVCEGSNPSPAANFLKRLIPQAGSLRYQAFLDFCGNFTGRNGRQEFCSFEKGLLD